MANKMWYYEIYILNPKTKERGWDIKVGKISSPTKNEAAAKIKEKYNSNFDEFIQLYQIAQ